MFCLCFCFIYKYLIFSHMLVKIMMPINVSVDLAYICQNLYQKYLMFHNVNIEVYLSQRYLEKSVNSSY